MLSMDAGKLRKAIARKGMHISEVQRKADLNGNTLYRLVNSGGKARLSTIGKVAQVLDVEIEDLIVVEV